MYIKTLGCHSLLVCAENRGCVISRVALDLIFSNLARAGFEIADPAGARAGAGAECS